MAPAQAAARITRVRAADRARACRRNRVRCRIGDRDRRNRLERGSDDRRVRRAVRTHPRGAIGGGGRERAARRDAFVHQARVDDGSGLRPGSRRRHRVDAPAAELRSQDHQRVYYADQDAASSGDTSTAGAFRTAAPGRAARRPAVRRPAERAPFGSPADHQAGSDGPPGIHRGAAPGGTLDDAAAQLRTALSDGTARPGRHARPRNARGGEREARRLRTGLRRLHRCRSRKKA